MIINPKIIHRIYFDEFKPYHDPFLHYLETWKKELPDYKILMWNGSNLDVERNEWTRRAYAARSPVFLAEYFRWDVLQKFGGVYLDADCEIINGRIFETIIDELFGQDEYDAFFGVEERSNGHPTAQTVGAKPNSEIIRFMKEMYDVSLSGPLWQWREKRGLIGPQLMSLYFLDKNINVKDDGFFKGLDKPETAAGCKIYPQSYFSPKFTILGDTIDFDEERTCIYHLFANSNIDFSRKPKLENARSRPLLFDEYRRHLSESSKFPRYYEGTVFETVVGHYEKDSLICNGTNGLLSYGPYISLQRGEYIADFQCDLLSDKGQIEIRVTAESGTELLASRSIEIISLTGLPLRLPFEVSRDLINQIEFLILIDGVDSIRLNGVSIEKANKPEEAESYSTPKTLSLRKLHRIYFGFDGKPDPFVPYLRTWEKELPEFEIMHWDISNLPMDANPYVKKLYAERDHAFLSDYFRWYVLREHGGIYLDADVELVNGDILRGLVKDLEVSETYDAFIGIDEAGGGWYTAHSMASKPNSDISRFMCELYADLGKFTTWRKKGFYFWAPQLTSLYFANNNHNVSGMGTSPLLSAPIVAAKVKIYPQEWFSPLAPSGDPHNPFRLSGLSDVTCLCHHFACSWHDSDSIYIQHSRTSGGQASVMLMDIIAKSRMNHFPSSSPSLSSQFPRKEDGTILSNGTSGYLVYGPYVPLQAGTYRLTLELRAVKSWGNVVVDIAYMLGQKEVAKRKIDEAEAHRIITIDFVLSEHVTDLECRLDIDANVDCAFTEMKIERIGT